jgi:DNA-binding PadR family transcriptional regulator
VQNAIDHDWVEFYGHEITERLGIQAGTIYPLLTRLHGAGWLSSTLEDRAAMACLNTTGSAV